MNIIKHDNINDFLSDNEELLLKKESFYNLILGLAYNIKDKKIEPSEPLYYSIAANGKIIGAALRSNSARPLIITELPAELIDLLIMDLVQQKIELAAVVAEENTAIHFKDNWIKLKNLDYKINIHLGAYECFNVLFPKTMSGELIEATIDHQNILRKFITGFLLECFPDQPIVESEIEKMIESYLKNKSIFLLKNSENQIISMAANTRSTVNGGTISLVYTPPELRGFGYASCVVSLLSERILKSGKKFACLFTDLKNPTSNSIYQKIGYAKIGHNIHFDFIKR